MTEDKSKMQTRQTKHNPEKASNAKHSKTKPPWFSRLFRHSARKPGGLILQRSRSHGYYKSLNAKYRIHAVENQLEANSLCKDGSTGSTLGEPWTVIETCCRGEAMPRAPVYLNKGSRKRCKLKAMAPGDKFHAHYMYNPVTNPQRDVQQYYPTILSLSIASPTALP